MPKNEENKNPRIFISYSWNKQNTAREIADRLLTDGVDVVIDVYDLKEGNDKYAFMEQMVTDTAITCVLVLSDSKYAKKADKRSNGVGTESQIISRQVYEKVQQEKFIPIVLEFDDDNQQPFLPVFFKSRIYIDFSTPEAINEHWEQLIRRLYGKPQYQKPKLGKVPLYITEELVAPPSKIQAKFVSLKQTVLQEKKTLDLYRKDFFESCYEYAESFRIFEEPDYFNFEQKIINDCHNLIHIRNAVVDWIFLESPLLSTDKFVPMLVELMEKLRDIASRPQELQSWREDWFEAERIFIYETFLYSIAALLKSMAFESLYQYLRYQFKIPDSEINNSKFDSFICFQPRYYYKWFKELPQRKDIPFIEIIQADIIAYLMFEIHHRSKNTTLVWYPVLLSYLGYRAEHLPFFVKAERHNDFRNLATVIGVKTADELRKKTTGIQLPSSNSIRTLSLSDLLNLKNLDTK
jgi:hypothetical protein